MQTQEYWSHEIAVIGIKREKLPIELKYLLNFNKTEDSDKILSNASYNDDYRSVIKDELEKMSQKDFRDYGTRVGFNFLELNDDYSILTDTDMTNVVNGSYTDTLQDWQLSLDGNKDGDILVFGNIYNSDGKHIGTAEIELTGENQLSFKDSNGDIEIKNYQDYEKIILNITSSFIDSANVSFNDLTNYVYPNSSKQIKREMGITSKNEFLYTISSFENEKILEFTTRYTIQNLKNKNTIELEKFAQKYYDKNFEINSSMSSFIYADIKDTKGNILLYNDESYSNILDAIDGIKTLTKKHFDKELTLYLVNNNSNNTELMQIENEGKKNQFCCNAITKENIDLKDIVGTLAKIDKGVYTFDLNNIILYGDSQLDVDKSINIEFENRQLHIAKSSDGVAVDVYCDQVLTNELGWLSNEDIVDLKEEKTINNKNNIDDLYDVITSMKNFDFDYEIHNGMQNGYGEDAIVIFVQEEKSDIKAIVITFDEDSNNKYPLSITNYNSTDEFSDDSYISGSSFKKEFFIKNLREDLKAIEYETHLKTNDIVEVDTVEWNKLAKEADKTQKTTQNIKQG